MRRLQRVWQAGRIAFFAMAGWLMACGDVFAQVNKQIPKKGDQEIGSGVWVFAYFIVILGIASGVLFVCRSGGRRDRAHPEQYGETKPGAK